MARGILEIDGRRIELTDEQVEKLLKSDNNDSFRRDISKLYYYIDDCGKIKNSSESNHIVDELRHNTANYCTDRELMQQRALHEILHRLLWRFSMENDGDKIDWDCNNKNKYKIYRSEINKGFYAELNYEVKSNTIYFYSKEITERAIKEIIEPFMKEHPEFVW